jgi:hypothetical protein
VARIDGQRRQHREDLVEEPLPQRVVMLRDRRVVDELDAFGGEGAPDRNVDRRMICDEVKHPLAGGRDLLLGGAAVR